MRLLVTLMIWIYSAALFSQTAFTNHKAYFDQLGMTDLAEYDYVIVYPIHYSNSCDRTWVDHFMNVDIYKWKGLLFVVIIEEQKQLLALNDYALARDNLVVDSTLMFQRQEFYANLPVIYSHQDGMLVEEVVLTWEHSYPWWRKLYSKYKN